MTTKQFSDRATYDPQCKTALSVRDGVLEYLGAELGTDYEPTRIYTIYRSPAQIANAAMRMQGIPITDEHVSLDEPAPNTGSNVASAEMVDASDPTTYTTIAIRNTLTIDDTMSAIISNGKRELSLGYFADLRPHDVYDFEQYDIKPHHLAAVQKGRCGPMCSFLDRKPTSTETKPMLHKVFKDAEGSTSLQQIVEIAAALPEAIKTVPIEKLQEILPALKDIMEIAKSVGVEDPESEPAETEMADEEKPEEEEEKPGFSDADLRKFTDEAIKRHTFAIEKARPFLGDSYQFADKSTGEIMRDALATQSTEKFADSEIELAFKLLKKQGPDYSKFGDSQAASGLEARIKKQLEA